MSKRQFDVAVVIGRFQIYHNAHEYIGKEALKIADRVIFVIGSVNKPRDINNPFTFAERIGMIKATLDPDEIDRVGFVPARENANDQVWASRVQELVTGANAARVGAIANSESVLNPKIALVGVKKDKSSFYLDMFPQWEYVGVDVIYTQGIVIHAKELRQQWYENTSGPKPISPEVLTFLNDFKFEKKIAYDNLVEEWKAVQQLKARWANSPYEPVFITTDAVVVQSGHILLVRRAARPGKGLWALPGGYLGTGERLIDSMLRELREETRLKVPTPVLKGSIKDYKEFDEPSRDVRGRFITHAYFVELANGPLPLVKGSTALLGPDGEHNDTDKARWVLLSDFWKMEDVMFADHYEIVSHFLGGGA